MNYHLIKKEISHIFITYSLVSHLLVFVLYISIYILIPQTHAKDDSKSLLRVSPAIVTVTLSPGQTTTYDIEIENLESSPIPVHIALESFDTTGEEGSIIPFQDQNQDTTPTLTQWMRIHVADTILDGNGKKTIPVELTVPSTVPLGGYQAVLTMTPLTPQISNDIPQVIPRIHVLFLANIGVMDSSIAANKRGRIETFEMRPFLSWNTPLLWTLRAHNTSLNYYSAKPIYTFTPILFGKNFKRIEQEKIILPGKIRRWEGAIEENVIPIGMYSVDAAVSVGDGLQIHAHTYILRIPWQHAIVIMTIGILLIYLYKKRKNITETFTILVTGKDRK